MLYLSIYTFFNWPSPHNLSESFIYVCSNMVPGFMVCYKSELIMFVIMEKQL